jgi:hypothetical protein
LPEAEEAACMSGFFFSKKNAAFTSRERRSYCYRREGLNFRDRDGLLIANLYTTFTAKAFFGVDRHGFAVLHFVNVNRTHFHAFLASFTLVVIHRDFVTHLIFPPLYIFLKRKHLDRLERKRQTSNKGK